MTHAKREYKDSLFRHLFGSEERKEEALELYNALAGTSFEDPEEIEINTIEDFIFLGRRNDVSFLIGDEMVLWEHQSTHNPNMPLRGLFYLSRLYEKLVNTRGLDLYGRSLVKLPTPRFFVFYFGSDKRPEREVMRLSDAFSAGSGDLELEATVLDCSEGHNGAIMDACEALRGYAHLVALVRRNQSELGMELQDAVHAAVDQCISENCLASYLSAHRAEVESMLFTMEDEERALRIHYEAIEREAREKGFADGRADGFADGFADGRKEGRAEGLEKGLEEGREEGREEALTSAIAALMDATGVSLDVAMDMLAVPADERPEYAAKLAGDA